MTNISDYELALKNIRHAFFHQIAKDIDEYEASTGYFLLENKINVFRINLYNKPKNNGVDLSL